MELITISRLKSARRCPRHHYYSYEIGRRPIRVSEALFFGTLFHVGLEQWWLAQQEKVDNALGLAIEAMRLKFAAASDEASATQFDLVRAEELMRGYHYRWLDIMDEFIVIGVESGFETPMINPLTGRPSQTYRLAGKIDVRIKLWDGTCRIIEHKTSSADITPGSDYWQRLRMDGQISQYYDGASSLGDDVQGCLYDVVKRPTQKPYMETPDENKNWTQPKSCIACREIAQAKHKSEWIASDDAPKFSKLPVASIPITVGCPDCMLPRLYSGQRDHDETVEEFRKRLMLLIAADPDAYYQRGDIVRLDEEMDEFRLDVWMQGKMLRERQLAAKELGVKAWPRNPDRCDDYHRLCEYYDACSGSANIEDDHLFRSTGTQHEELG